MSEHNIIEEQVIESEEAKEAAKEEVLEPTPETEPSTPELTEENAPTETADDENETSDPSDADSIFDLESRQQLVGKVKNITNFGAFIDLGLPQDGLVHISELSRKKVDKVEDVVSVGQEVEVWVKKVDRKRGRISLTMIKPIERRIRDIEEGEEVEGTVTRLESYGAFVDIGSERDGLVHISQITHDYIKHPEEALSVGDKVQVKVLKVNRKKRQIDLSIKALLPPPAVQEEPALEQKPEKVEEIVEEAVETDEPMPTAMAVAFANLNKEAGDESLAGEEKGFDQEKRKHREEQAEIISRTLASNT